MFIQKMKWTFIFLYNTIMGKGGYRMSNLCIDFGSTFVKFFIRDHQNTVFFDKLSFPKPCVNDGVRYEVSIENIDDIVKEIFERTKDFRIKKCFIAVQMHGYVLKNCDGSFSNYISWKDKSGDIENPLISKIDFIKI